MHDLPPEAEALLAAARRELPTPDAAVSERVRRGIAAAVMVSAIAASAKGLATKATLEAAAQPFVAMPLLAKAGLGIVTVAALGALAGPALFAAQKAPTAAEVAHSRRRESSARVSAPAAQEAAPAESEPIEHGGLAAPAEAGHAPVRPPVRIDAREQNADTQASSSLRAELALLDRVSRALERRDAAGAQSLLGRYRTTFRQPLLAEERDGFELIALCIQDRESARARLEAFLARADHAVLRARVERACRRFSR